MTDTPTHLSRAAHDVLVERIARALCNHIHGGCDFGMDPDSVWNEPRAKAEFLAQGKAVADAIAPTLVTSAMVDAAWNEGKNRRMTGLPSDFRAVLGAALAKHGGNDE